MLSDSGLFLLLSILYKLVGTPLDRRTIVKTNSIIYVYDMKYFTKNDSNGYIENIARIKDRPGQGLVTRGKARLIHCSLVCVRSAAP